jgi:hypothetical protein
MLFEFQLLKMLINCSEKCQNDNNSLLKFVYYVFVITFIKIFVK